MLLKFEFHSVYDIRILNVTHHASCDEDLVVCGYTDGSCEVFNAATSDFLYKIEEQERDFIPSSSKVYLGKDIVVKIAFGTDALAGRGKSDIGIWSKISQRKIFSCFHNSRNLCVYLKVHKNTLLIRCGKQNNRIVIQYWLPVLIYSLF